MKRLLLFAALIAWSGMAGAVVYKWVDAQGKVQYGDRPPDGVNAEVVELLGTHIPRSASARTPDSSNSTGQPKIDPAKKAVDEDVAQAREKQCTEAQDRYKKLIEGRRPYKLGPDGARQYLTSDEIDTERLDAKQEVDSVCKNSS
jgi:hypothetical protein